MDAFISDDEAVSIKEDFFRLFLTSKLMGETANITFERDILGNGTYTTHTVTDVYFRMADREPETVSSPAAVSVRADGLFKRETPFNVMAGDRFNLLGIPGMVTVVYPVMNDIVQADFILDRPGV